jgi:hypothetical protein
MVSAWLRLLSACRCAKRGSEIEIELAVKRAMRAVPSLSYRMIVLSIESYNLSFNILNLPKSIGVHIWRPNITKAQGPTSHHPFTMAKSKKYVELCL